VELDQKRIDSYLQQIATEAGDLEKILALPDGQLVSDRAKLKSLKYSVIVIAEAMTGALQHILAKKHSVAVDGYSDALMKSTQHKLVDEELLGRLRPFFVFRNMLVHQYWKVQDETFLKNLRAGLSDFREFVRKIRSATSISSRGA
jgi:uncharacterized protein YutE (UPF0331/DUF86 family)